VSKCVAVAFWRKGDSVLAALLRFNVSWVRGRSVNSPSCRRRTTFRRFGWGGLPATLLAAHARALELLARPFRSNRSSRADESDSAAPVVSAAVPDSPLPRLRADAAFPPTDVAEGH
jgi:hypothetical protein